MAEPTSQVFYAPIPRIETIAQLVNVRRLELAAFEQALPSVLREVTHGLKALRQHLTAGDVSRADLLPGDAHGIRITNFCGVPMLVICSFRPEPKELAIAFDAGSEPKSVPLAEVTRTAVIEFVLDRVEAAVRTALSLPGASRPDLSGSDGRT